MYDVVAKRLPVWGRIYSFVELGLGLAYLTNVAPFWTNIATIVILGVSAIGVIQSVLDKWAIKCACLGTGLPADEYGDDYRRRGDGGDGGGDAAAKPVSRRADGLGAFASPPPRMVPIMPAAHPVSPSAAAAAH